MCYISRSCILMQYSKLHGLPFLVSSLYKLHFPYSSHLYWRSTVYKCILRWPTTLINTYSFSEIPLSRFYKSDQLKVCPLSHQKKLGKLCSIMYENMSWETFCMTWPIIKHFSGGRGYGTEDGHFGQFAASWGFACWMQ